jgi:DNA-directed RNA polymerase II subunit RPB2
VSSRAGGKGIMALALNAADMPYTEDGLIPDIIVNPHSVPTRMCIGQLIEMVEAEYAIENGGFLDSTIFKKNDLSSMVEWLRDHTPNNKNACHRRMFSGKTGMYMDTLIFIGNNYYNRIMKFVALESYSINSGPTAALTRQPLEGQNAGGGLRLGEMEVWVQNAHGTMRTLGTKIYNDSDGIKLPICRICGERAIVNEKSGIYKCKKCKDNADIAQVDSSWVANLFMHEMQAMGVKVDLQLEPYSYTERLE